MIPDRSVDKSADPCYAVQAQTVSLSEILKNICTRISVNVSHQYIPESVLQDAKFHTN